MNRLLEQGPSFVPLFTAAAVASSALYNISYFVVVEPRMLLLTTLSDYISYAVLATVPVLPMLLFILFASSSIPRVQQALHKPQNQAEAARSAGALISASLTPAVIAVFFFVSLDRSIKNKYDTMPKIVLASVSLGFISSVLGVSWLVTLGKIKLSYESAKIMSLSFILLTSLIVPSGLGYVNAKLNVSLSVPLYPLSTRIDGNIAVWHNIILLRSMERGLLVRRRDAHSLVFLPWNEVVMLRRRE